MSTGTVSLHSWNDGADTDDGDPPMGANYGAKLEPRESFRRPMQERQWARAQGRGLRSSVVRPSRLGQEEAEEGGW